MVVRPARSEDKRDRDGKSVERTFLIISECVCCNVCGLEGAESRSKDGRAHHLALPSPPLVTPLSSLSFPFVDQADSHSSFVH